MWNSLQLYTSICLNTVRMLVGLFLSFSVEQNLRGHRSNMKYIFCNLYTGTSINQLHLLLVTFTWNIFLCVHLLCVHVMGTCNMCTHNIKKYFLPVLCHLRNLHEVYTCFSYHILHTDYYWGWVNLNSLFIVIISIYSMTNF